MARRGGPEFAQDGHLRRLPAMHCQPEADAEATDQLSVALSELFREPENEGAEAFLPETVALIGTGKPPPARSPGREPAASTG